MSPCSCPPLRMTFDQAEAAHQAFRFNCGPASLCAVLGMTPEEIRPHLLDFEQKGYMNPTLMADILHGLAIPFRRVYACMHKLDNKSPTYPRFGLVRIQWGGPWTKPGVPIAARYRKTHWIATRPPPLEGLHYPEVFDVNALGVGGWLNFHEWSEEMVPWLLTQVLPQWDGLWWPTHCWEITGRESR